MKTAFLLLQSFTEAKKASLHLEKLKINSKIEKTTTKSGGCGYGIRISGDAEKVCRHLGIVNIKCREIIYGDN